MSKPISEKDKQRYSQMLTAFIELATLAANGNVYAAKVLDSLTIRV